MSVTDPIKRELGKKLFTETTGLFGAFPLIAISVCDGVGWVSGILTSALFLQSPAWLLRGLGLEVCLQCKLNWSGKLSLSFLKECLDMRYAMTLCKNHLFLFFPSQKHMIIELFPVACLAHNCPFIVLKMSFSLSPVFKLMIFYYIFWCISVKILF